MSADSQSVSDTTCHTHTHASQTKEDEQFRLLYPLIKATLLYQMISQAVVDVHEYIQDEAHDTSHCTNIHTADRQTQSICRYAVLVETCTEHTSGTVHSRSSPVCSQGQYPSPPR